MISAFDVLGLPLLDEAVELRLRGGGVGAADREHRRRAVLDAIVAEAGIDDRRRPGASPPREHADLLAIERALRPSAAT